MLVSVYMPTKDRLADLQVAVRSVLNQDYPYVELIVVNEGSSDGTKEWLDHLSITHVNVTVIHHQKPLGAPASRNEAIRLARGEFITGLDDDDYFLPGRISAFVAYWAIQTATGEPFSCLYAQDRIDFGNGRLEDTNKRSSVSLEDMFSGNCVGNQIFTTKKIMLESGLFDETLPAWQDLETFLRVIKCFGPAKILDIANYYYNNLPRPDRITVSQKSKILSAYQNVMKKHAPSGGINAQKLYLQVFNPCYGFKPNLSDWWYFISLGFWPKGIVKMVMKYFV